MNYENELIKKNNELSECVTRIHSSPEFNVQPYPSLNQL